MAKGQKRSNREVKKPKATKEPKERLPASGQSLSDKLEHMVPAKKSK